MPDRVNKPAGEPSAEPASALARDLLVPHLRLRSRNWIFARGKWATRLIGRKPFQGAVGHAGYGYAAGDDVLKLVAERIASGTQRTSDMAARYGGEEFAVLLPGTALEGARKIADKIRRRIETANLAHRGSRYGRVTVSVGCASCEPPAGGSGAKLLAAADALLYEAKAAGRNQVCAKQWRDGTA